MIAKHTLTHAIQYLRDAAVIHRQCSLSPSEVEALAMIDPHKPCAAYGLAKRTLRRCGSLTSAIADLTKQLEAS